MPERGRREGKILIGTNTINYFPVFRSSLYHYCKLIMVRISFLRPLMIVLCRYGNQLVQMITFSPWLLLLFARIITINIFQLNGLHQRCWRMHKPQTRRESPIWSAKLPAGRLCDLGKGTSHLFSSPISFAYLSTSLTVCNRVPPVWPPVVTTEQTSASSPQPLAFICVFLFVFRRTCPPDPQGCDGRQWTG